jgi:hypothetical protein
MKSSISFTLAPIITESDTSSLSGRGKLDSDL